MKDKVVMLIDSMSFYASVEQNDNIYYRDKPLIVSGDPERRSGIILAACPLAKAKGVKTAEPLWEARLKCPEAIVVRPRMQRYIDVSLKISEIFKRYTDIVEEFSVDESFCELTNSQSLFGAPMDLAKSIIETVKAETGINVRIGIGNNKIRAKLALDCLAKKSDSGIAEINDDNIEQLIWHLPIGKMFGVGNRMNQHLNRMGIRTIGHLANYPVELLRKRWGINGQVLWQTANGIDRSNVTPVRMERKSIGNGMTLPTDYTDEKDIKAVLLTLAEEICYRSRTLNLFGSTVSASCRGADFDEPTGFHRQTTLLNPTNYTMDVFNVAWKLFERHWNRMPIRYVGISIANLNPSEECQLSLFDDHEKNMKIGDVMDSIKARFGKTAICRASTITAAGQALDRANKIGGHYL